MRAGDINRHAEKWEQCNFISFFLSCQWETSVCTLEPPIMAGLLTVQEKKLTRGRKESLCGASVCPRQRSSLYSPAELAAEAMDDFKKRPDNHEALSWMIKSASTKYPSCVSVFRSREDSKILFSDHFPTWKFKRSTRTTWYPGEDFFGVISVVCRILCHAPKSTMVFKSPKRPHSSLRFDSLLCGRGAISPSNRKG